MYNNYIVDNLCSLNKNSQDLIFLVKIYPNITLEMFNVEPLKHRNIVYRKDCVIISFLAILVEFNHNFDQTC